MAPYDKNADSWPCVGLPHRKLTRLRMRNRMCYATS